MSVDTLSTTAAAAQGCVPGALSDAPEPARAREIAAIAKALSDPIRVSIVAVLRRHPGEICQCELQQLFDVSQPTLSHHLGRLAECGIVAVERRGVWAYYAIREERLEVLEAWLSQTAAAR
jgi:ArsR family transcriptional regulator